MDRHLKNRTVHLYKNVFKFAYKRTKDTEASKDIAQTVIEKCISKINEIKKPDSFEAWVMQIAANEISSYFRVIQRYKKNIIIRIDEEEDPIPEICDIEADILQLLIEREDRANIIKALLRLDPKYQTVIRMNLIYEYPLVNIAELLGINYNTVKTRYIRGIRLLKEEFFIVEKEK